MTPTDPAHLPLPAPPHDHLDGRTASEHSAEPSPLPRDHQGDPSAPEDPTQQPPPAPLDHPADRTSNHGPYPTVALTVDIALFTVRAGELVVLLVQRSTPPFWGKWALPGGFVQPEEDTDIAARRVLAQETGVVTFAGHLEQLRTYSEPERDPRTRAVSVAYVAMVPRLPAPARGRDTAAVQFWPTALIPVLSDTDTSPGAPPAQSGVRRLAPGESRPAHGTQTPGVSSTDPSSTDPNSTDPSSTDPNSTDISGENGASGDEAGIVLAFDHTQILADAVERVRSKIEYTALAASFVDEPFTIGELRQVYETVWGVRLHRANFRRKVLSVQGFVVPTDAGARRAPVGSAGGRPAQLYRRGPVGVLHPPILRPGLDPDPPEEGELD